ncbi:winged helix-turn-helix domain-containing protein, partial [Streptomyces sp. NPDC056527]|uniref:helix-turn-helix domain-containing protein n=1 Tax=Streptomyces sp. NPDC056527 TaxID=3345853 RepID=UPI0036C55206
MPTRIADVVRRQFGVTYTLAGMDLLPRRIGWSVQLPTRKATERDEARIAARLRLTIYRLSPYAPELNPIDGVRSHSKRSLTHLTTHSLDQLIALTQTRFETDAEPPPPHRGSHHQDQTRLST